MSMKQTATITACERFLKWFFRLVWVANIFLLYTLLRLFVRPPILIYPFEIAFRNPTVWFIAIIALWAFFMLIRIYFGMAERQLPRSVIILSLLWGPFLVCGCILLFTNSSKHITTRFYQGSTYHIALIGSGTTGGETCFISCGLNYKYILYQCEPFGIFCQQIAEVSSGCKDHHCKDPSIAVDHNSKVYMVYNENSY